MSLFGPQRRNTRKRNNQLTDRDYENLNSQYLEALNKVWKLIEVKAQNLLDIIFEQPRFVAQYKVCEPTAVVYPVS